MTRTLLIDADILAYRASSANQRSYDWGDGVTGVAADEVASRRFAEEEVERLADRLQADEVTICLSDDWHSFRKDRVDPTYKDVRTTVDRPVHLYDIKEWMASEYDTVRWTALEADDVMGIIATDPNRTDERIVVSADKDLMGVPCRLYRPQEQTSGKPKIRDIGVEQADTFHLFQTLTGDTVDGYSGCPGLGPVGAEALLGGMILVRHERELSRGPRKGMVLTEWKWEEHDGPVWDRVISAYERAGLTEADALRQARLARILRFDEWDGRSPKLWSPPA